MAELIACGPEPGQRRRRPLPNRPITLGRLPEFSDWAVPWDQQISSLHATLVWSEGRLVVTRIPPEVRKTKNSILFLGEDQGFSPFAVTPGDTFVIGETLFSVVAPQTVDLPSPRSQLTLSAEELRQVKYVDANERLDVLATLPEVIRHSSSDADLETRVLDLLLRGVPRCTAAGVVCLRQGGDAGPEVTVSATVARDTEVGPLLVSRELVLAALGRQQSALYRWDVDGPQGLGPVPAGPPTVYLSVDWAICAPLPDTPPPGWGLYLMGRVLGQPREELLKGDLKFVEAVAAIFGSLRHLRDLQAERAQVQASLRIAQEIQAGFFPRQMPLVPGYELAACSHPAEATGGDYYDVLPLRSGRLGLVVADVCGKGLGPSLLMASVRAALCGIAAMDPQPDELVTELSGAMFDDLNPRYRFITLLYGVLDPAEHLFRYANAGHGPLALHFCAATREFHSLAEDDLRGGPLGVFRDPYQACVPRQLAPGDLLLLGSDGITEARRGDELFDLKRLKALVLRHLDRPVAELLAVVLEAATAFAEGGHPDDDLTLVVLRRS